MRTGVLVEEVLAALGGAVSGRAGRVLDLGGGTGGLAVQLAEAGHAVTVVDPSPDSLAALGRRAAEAGVGDRITGLQGDAGELGRLVPAGGFDLALCHTVLEYVDDPVAALRTAAATLAAGGLVSVLVANRVAAVLARVGAGRLAEADRLLRARDGAATGGDPLSRRFTPETLREALTGSGLRVRTLHGVRVFADVVPAAVIDDAAAAEQLLALEATAARDPSYLAVATQLHAVCEQAGP